jgi:hypothetical protein
VRGKDAQTILKATITATGGASTTTPFTADQVQSEIIVVQTITLNTTNGSAVIQFPNTAGDKSDGQMWWVDFRNVTFANSKTLTIAGTTGGNPTTGVTYSAVPSANGSLLYWDGTDMRQLL